MSSCVLEINKFFRKSQEVNFSPTIDVGRKGVVVVEGGAASVEVSHHLDALDYVHLN